MMAVTLNCDQQIQNHYQIPTEGPELLHLALSMTTLKTILAVCASS